MMERNRKETGKRQKRKEGRNRPEVERRMVEAAGQDGAHVMSKEEFSEFAEAFDHTIKELCENFKSGEIAARPKRTGDVTACRYCAYKGICRFDITVPGYDYEKIV